MKEKIAVIIPTRGMFYTESFLSIMKNLEGHDYKFYISYDKNIPNGINDLTDQALADGHKLLWFLEEDMVVPEGTLDKLVKADVDFIATEYPILQGQSSIWFVNGEVAWAGIGCALIKSSVFELFRKPYFRVDKRMVVINDTKEGFEVSFDDNYSPFGGYESYFGIMCREAGIKITHLKGVMCQQGQLFKLAPNMTNNGVHDIKMLKDIQYHFKFEPKKEWYRKRPFGPIYIKKGKNGSNK